MITPIINRPDLVRQALMSTKSFTVIDLETTGLTRNDDIVSVGVLVDGTPHILFCYTRFTPVITRSSLQHALEPLAMRDDLVIVGHNIGFDLGFLSRADIKVRAAIHDTELLLRLIDSDRGKNKDVVSARIDRLAPPGSPRVLDYRLKHIVPQLLNICMIDYDEETGMEVLPYEQHVLYLSSDLLGTAELYNHLMARLTPSQREYNDKFIAPITPILVGMAETGIRLDTNFINTQVLVLQNLKTRFSEEHRRAHGVPLDMNQQTMCEWLFGTLRVVPTSYKKLSARERALGRPRVPSLDSKHLEALAHIHSGNQRVSNSLTLIRSHRLATSLMAGLKKLTPYCSPRDGRIHTRLRDTQSTGRISSTKPNLQGLTKPRMVAGVEVRSRNTIVATEGFLFCDFDIKQADIRILGHHVAAFPCLAETYLKRLQHARLESLKPQIGVYLDQLEAHRNKHYQSKHLVKVPDYNPALPCALGAILKTAAGDPYPEVAARIIGCAVADVTQGERQAFKQVTLGVVNSITPTGLAMQLNYGDDKAAITKAKGHMEEFFATYPQVKLYSDTMWWHVALTGMTTTWAGRTRVCSAHRWMVSLPRVELLCSFNQGREWLWLDVIPLRPSRHCLTVWVKRIWDSTYGSSNYGRLVYEDSRGPLCTYPYHILDDSSLLYYMPTRNLSWRSIRRVRTDSEEAIYYGFDSTARSLVNSIYQGGTTDISRIGLLRCRPLCERYGARLLLQIHDEILAECPSESATEFAKKMAAILEQPPSPEFHIPIRVEPKIGSRFGNLKPVE